MTMYFKEKKCPKVMQGLNNIPVYRQLYLFVTLIISGISQPALAQESHPKTPTPVEFMTGNNRMFFQMVVIKKFSPESKFDFLSVSSFASSYDNNEEDLDIAIPLYINYTIYKGFSITGGATVNNHVGIFPRLGAKYSFTNRKWVAVTIASLYLNSQKNAELFGIYEYKPQLSPKTNLYTRLQFLYIHSIRDNLHARSFLQLRTGLKMNALNFGIGANLDQYGPQKTFKPNYGVFMGWAFQ